MQFGGYYDRKWLKKCLDIARDSLCQKMKYGSILITAESNLKYDGVNGQVPGMIDVVNPVVCGYCLRTDIPSGTYHERCYALHAEQMAVMRCLLEGDNPQDGTVYVSGFHADTGQMFIYNEPGFYCSTCVRMMRAVGISGIVVPVSIKWALLANYDSKSMPNDYAVAVSEGWLPVYLFIEHAWDYAYSVAMGARQAPGIVRIV